jgi:hypothetical protein
VETFASQRDYLNEIKRKFRKMKFFDAGINSPYSDYGSAYYNNTTFASARDTGGVAKKCSSGTMNLYQFVQLPD